MRRLFLILASLAVLTACSAHTIVVADIDLLSLAQGTGGLEGDFNVPGNVGLYVPDADNNPYAPDGGYQISDLPALDHIYGLGVDVVVNIKNTGSGALDLQAEFRLAPADDNVNIYDGVEDVELANASLHLGAGEQGQLRLQATLEKGDQRLALITSDGFRIGVHLQVTGSSSVHYQLSKFNLTVEQRPFDLIPAP